MDGLLKRVDFEMQINYHTAAQLLLYPIGFQVETYTADDPIYRALVGHGRRLGRSRATARARRTTTTRTSAPSSTPPTARRPTTLHGKYGTLGVDAGARRLRRRLAAAAAASSSSRTARKTSRPCSRRTSRSRSTSRSPAKDPANPVSHLGNEPADFEVSRFDDLLRRPAGGAGQRQARARQRDHALPRQRRGRADGAPPASGRAASATATSYDVYYHRLRGEVKGTKPGDEVSVWFEGGGKKSQSFTYTQALETSNKVLILASEDYTGKSPEYDDTSGPNYLSYYQQALQANGIGYDVWDTDARGRTAPDPLGVLSHYKAIVWYTGDNERTIEPDQPATGAGASKLSDDEFRRRARLPQRGRQAALHGQERAGWDSRTSTCFNAQGSPPYCTMQAVGAPTGACIPLSNDFLQYYLGSYGNGTLRRHEGGARRRRGRLLRSDGGARRPSSTVAGSARQPGPRVRCSRRPARCCRRTSSRSSSPPRSATTRSTGRWPRGRATSTPTRRSRDAAYKRLTRTVDLTGKTSGTLKFWTSYDTEPDYDYMFVEAHTVGQDDWTTLPDENGNTSQALDPAAGSCADGWAAPDGQHPFLSHYMNPHHVRPDGHDGRVERGDGQLRRLPGLGDRPLVLRRQAGRGLDRGRQRPVHPGPRRVRRRHRGARGRAVGCRDVVRGRSRRLVGHRAAGRERAESEQLGPDRRRCSRSPRPSRRLTASTSASASKGSGAPATRNAIMKLRHEAPRRARVSGGGPGPAAPAARRPGPGAWRRRRLPDVHLEGQAAGRPPAAHEGPACPAARRRARGARASCRSRAARTS